MNRLTILLFSLLFSTAAAAARYPMLEPCKPDATALCGTIQVPENRSAKKGRTIPIRVMVIPSKSATPEPDPMFALTGGGPGIASIPDAESWVSNFPEIAATRDVVFFDQRGTGESNALDCPLGDAATRAFLAGEIPSEGVRACREQLAQRADLKSYTTADAADDMEEIRRRLGFSRINIYGSSYTARLAMVYAQRYPKRVRTVTMKAATPFALRNPLYAAASAQAALDRLFADCGADAACREKYPDLKAQFEIASRQSDPALFAGAIRRMLYSADAQRSLPFVITSAARGDLAPLQPVLKSGEVIDRLLNLGLFLSVTCAEDVARFSEAEAVEAAKGTFSGPVLATALLGACRGWNVPARQPITKKSSAEALIISGPLDPDTPPRFGEETLRLFPRGLHVIVPGMAHSGSPQCVRDLVTRFVLSGDAKTLDTSCVKEQKRPAFR